MANTLGFMVISLFLTLNTNAQLCEMSPKKNVAKWNQCVHVNRSDNKKNGEVMERLQKWIGKKPKECGYLCTTSDRYKKDRCWSPRAHCALTPTGASYGLIVTAPLRARKKWMGTNLVAGKYVVALGAANCMGVGAYPGWDEQLFNFDIPIVNFGITAAGPRTFIEQWKAIEYIVSNAAAVVIVTMSGRSSENDSCTWNECPFHPKRLTAWNQLRRKGKTEKAARMKEQSLDNAIAEYTQILQLIDKSACTYGQKPKTILLWMTEMQSAKYDHPTEMGKFPHWWTETKRVQQLFNLGWNFVVDASYDKTKYTPKYPRHRIDQCDPESPARIKNCKYRKETKQECHFDDIRDEERISNGCTDSCAFSYVPGVYPSQYGHDVAAQKLKPMLKDILNSNRILKHSTDDTSTLTSYR